MEGLAKKELLQLAKRLRKKAEQFERAKDFGKAEQARVYAQFLEESVESVD
jgi:cell fate (sporulation/competence/biofilm development) regulator YmcA (YheA/YmcA/DUF963 family)